MKSEMGSGLRNCIKMFSQSVGAIAGTARNLLQIGNEMAQCGRGAGKMLGDFCKRARTKSYRKPGDECARLCRLPNSAWCLESTFSQAIALADISHDLPKRWRSDSRVPLGKHFLHKILLADTPAIRLPAVIHLGMPLADT